MHYNLYLITILVSALITGVSAPLIRVISGRLGWLDRPSSAVKTHKFPTPTAGGVSIWLGFSAALLLIRFWTQFPTGTLHSLRAILLGGALIFLLGWMDDVLKPAGIHFRAKFAVQFVAAILLLYFGIHMRFIEPDYWAWCLTLLWVVGITNALNIIDIMDGLCASQVAIASLGFLCIALPSEDIYVNFASSALLGAALGFLPYNISSRFKLFMGDSGSLFMGFVLAAVSLGTSYSQVNPLGVYAPLLILGIPIYDTFFVMVLRGMKGQSPFLGSKDHFALRLEAMGVTRPQVVFLSAAAGLFLSFCAFLVTRLNLLWALGVYLVIGAAVLRLSFAIAKVKVH